MMSNTIPERQIRAHFDDQTIRVYQAYSNTIADSALSHGTFTTPPFKVERMTWIKPSFLWMMYRSGWGLKETGQQRILAIDISHEGFLWALSHSCPSNFNKQDFVTESKWKQAKDQNPVRVQWDPERNLELEKLDYRSIQIGLSGEAVKRYLTQWIVKITDITAQAAQINALRLNGQAKQAQDLLPEETIFTLPAAIRTQLGMI